MTHPLLNSRESQLESWLDPALSCGGDEVQTFAENVWQLIFWCEGLVVDRGSGAPFTRQIILTAVSAMMVTIIPSSSYIIPSSSSFHPPPSLALFLWFNNNRSSHKKIGRIRRHHHHHHHHERRLPFSLTLSAATTPSLPSQPGGGGKGELYNDNELLELLHLHQSISTTNSFTTDNDARVDVDADITISGETEEGSPTTDSLGGIHDWVLQALENDIGIYNDDYGTNNNNDNSDFDYINGSDNNIIIEDETEEGPPLMSTVVHDWILQAIENDSPMITSFDAVVDDDDEEKGEDDSSSSMKNAANRVVVVATNNDNNHLQMLLQKRKPYIRAIATDVDGTLLNGTYMHPITRDAILCSIRQSSYSNDCGGESKRYFFFVATGKSRAGAITSLGPEIGSLISSIPGVYCQGLYCIDNQGKVIFERKLQHSAIQATEALAIEYGISIVAYDGDNLYTTNCTDSVIGLSEVYGEPRVQLLFDEQTSGGGGGGASPISLADYRPGFHKILLLDDDLVKLGHVRIKLEILASLHNATVTQAIPTMLELLPVGCSKAYGVEQVCLSLGINPRTELLAIGDAENDVGMLQIASIGIAVGNASPQARDAADFTMKERNDEGGAGLAMNLFGF